MIGVQELLVCLNSLNPTTTTTTEPCPTPEEEPPPEPLSNNSHTGEGEPPEEENGGLIVHTPTENLCQRAEAGPAPVVGTSVGNKAGGEDIWAWRWKGDEETMDFDKKDIERWLERNPATFREFFLKKGDLNLVNVWLMEHGFMVIREGGNVHDLRSPAFLGPNTTLTPTDNRLNASNASSRRASGASGDSLSPGDKLHDFGFHLDENGHRRCNSKRCLRNDFARAKSRSVYQVEDGCAGSFPGFLPNSASRRSSLKEMRKYTSLPPNSINILSLLIESKVKLPRIASKNLEIKRDLKRMDEKTFFLDVVKEIANDLDLRSLTKKITENLTVLCEAEAASLFLIEGPKGKKKLVSKVVFDVPYGTSIIPTAIEDNSIQVPWGKGIIGFVAETGESVNLQVAYEDPRYLDGVDRVMDQNTDSLLCMAIRSDDDIIAVAQVVNKIPSKNTFGFTREDEKLLETYLQFVGIALTNAKIMSASRFEYERNRNLLEVVHDLFEEQVSLEKVIRKIMQRAQNLLKCEQAAVLLLDENCAPEQEIVFSKLFELNSPVKEKEANGLKENSAKPESETQTQNQTQTEPEPAPEMDTETEDAQDSIETSIDGSKLCPSLLRIARQVAKTGEVVNMTRLFGPDTAHVKSLLAMPIRNRDSEIIGIASILNKLNGHPFNDQDEQLFEAFTIFCGLGINNTLTYNELERANARQKVSIEVLSYHATATAKDTESLRNQVVPSADEWELCSLSFDDFSLEPDQMVVAAIRMFLDLGLLTRFKIDYGIMCRWLLTIQRNYRIVPYHNWRHAFNVAQVMFAILMSCEMKDTFTEMEVLGMFVACLCHDLDHRGTNNSFQAKTGSALAALYGTQNTMEHHHFNHAVMILNSEGHNIFSGLASEDYVNVMNVLKQSILATDLTTYFKRRQPFFDLIDNSKYSWEDEDQRVMLRNMLMTASDLAASTKPWTVQRRVAELVTAEFFAQGDQERQQFQITPPASMDRERVDELPQLQIRWVSDICMPLYQSLTTMNPKFDVMINGARNNVEQWTILSELPEEERMSFVSSQTETPL